MKRCLAFLGGCVLLAGCGTPSLSLDSAYAPSVARIATAAEMMNTCPGVGPGLEVDESFIISAADFEAAQTGLSTQKIRSVAFYGDRTSIHAARDALLTERGVTVGDSAALCAYASKVAGTNDPLGQLIAVQ
ncbi:hypothetical protein [Dinoroseobacter sp. S76]|uniref:hypothetical protein n=1 Tax=Dinoroseobacter sp. S76 TaxID=3415124 RepID=UPI003C7B2E33